MALEFPTRLISKVCCTNDGATLELGKNCQLSEDGGFVRHGTLRCCHCNTNFAIDDGILKMLNDIALDNQSKREQQLPLAALSRFLERIPLANNLGGLILCTVERPIRADLHAERYTR